MEATLLPIMTVFKALHQWKADVPMELTPLPMDTSTRLGHE